MAEINGSPNSLTVALHHLVLNTVKVMDNQEQIEVFVTYSTILAKGNTGGQQGDPLEMLVFNLTIQVSLLFSENMFSLQHTVVDFTTDTLASSPQSYHS